MKPSMTFERGPDPRFFDGRGSGCSLFERPSQPEPKPELLQAFRLGQLNPGLQVDFQPIDEARRAVGYPVRKDILAACLAATERAFDVPSERLLAPCRQAPVVRARFACMWLLRRVAGWSMPMIRDQLRLSHHTTIIHGIARAETLRETDLSFRLLTDAMFKAVSGPKGRAHHAG